MRASGSRIALLLLLLLVASCSSTTFVYNRLHIAIPWYLDGYVDLDRQQKRTLDQLLAVYLDYHRLDHLPRYVELLDQSLAMLDQRFTAAQMARLYGYGEEELAVLQEESLAWLLPVAESLSDEQVAEFIATLWEKHEEYREEYLERDDAEFRKETRATLEKNLGKYLGRLEGEQKVLIDDAVARLQRWDHLWLEQRARRIDRLALVLQRESGWQRRLRQLLFGWEQQLPAQYTAVYDHNRDILLAALSAVVDRRSDRQDLHLRRKVTGLREDLCDLIIQGHEDKRLTADLRSDRASCES